LTDFLLFFSSPPFCANCGAKTKYFGKASTTSYVYSESDESDDLPEPPPPVPDDEDEFGQDMLDELLDELRLDGGGSTRGTASRDTFAVKGTERFSEREGRKPKQQSTKMPRDTFAVKGTERFSGREEETSREAKAKAKAKAKAAGAKPAVGGGDWEQLQAQMKKKQQSKKTQTNVSSRDTFAVSGTERFSGRQVQPKKKTAAAPKKSVMQSDVDELDAELAMLEADLNEGVGSSSSSGSSASKASNMSRDTFAVSGTERFSGRQTKQSSRGVEKQAAKPMPRDTFANVSGTERFSGRQTKQAPRQQKQQQMPRDTFANVSGTERFSGRERREMGRQTKQVEADIADFDAELAALEADLGENMMDDVPPPSGAPSAGRVHVMSQPVMQQMPQKKVLHSNRKAVKTEKAQGGPALPEGLSWQQTPIRQEMERGTFAHNGTDRFSERKNPNLPKGVITEEPAQACAGCHKPIAPGEKFKTALNAVWHATCFKCGICLKPLVKGMKFFKGDMGSAVCEDCKKKRRQLCYLCKKPTARAEIVNVTGLKVHTHCFRCNICDTSLVSGYIQSKGQFLCIAHGKLEPVQRNWADPNDRGPGTAPERAPVQFAPSESDRKLRAEKKRRQDEMAKERANMRNYRQTMQGEKDALVDLDLLNDLLEEDGPTGNYVQGQEDRASDILRYADADRASSGVRKPRRSSIRK
jgi:hypothetical protein